MSIPRTAVEDYADEMARLTVNFIEEVKKFSEFNRYTRGEADKFQESIAKETKTFIKNLKVIGRIPIEPSGNIYERVVDYLLRGKESEESPYNLVSVKEMLTEIEKGFAHEVTGSIDIMGIKAPEKTVKTYFSLIKKSLKENIRKHRPDVFRIMNPTQKTIE